MAGVGICALKVLPGAMAWTTAVLPLLGAVVGVFEAGFGLA